jgi:hypothetical protein
VVQDERYPGFWEVPVWVLQTSKYPMDAYAMDPSGDVLALLKVNFDAVSEAGSERDKQTQLPVASTLGRFLQGVPDWLPGSALLL